MHTKSFYLIYRKDYIIDIEFVSAFSIKNLLILLQSATIHALYKNICHFSIEQVASVFVFSLKPAIAKREIIFRDDLCNKAGKICLYYFSRLYQLWTVTHNQLLKMRTIWCNSFQSNQGDLKTVRKLKKCKIVAMRGKSLKASIGDLSARTKIQES
jgi:hypothetical protein